MNEPPDDAPSRDDSSPLRQLARVLLIATVVVVIIAGIVWVQLGLTSARAAMKAGDYATSRAAAERYLWLHPGDVETRMFAADGYTLDDTLPPEVAAREAIAHLQHVPDDSERGAEARTLEGRLTFLILKQPTHAERLFERAVELDPQQFDAHYMLWKLYDMTERYFYSEPIFRSAYALILPEQRPLRLREWYLSQFSPLSACAELDGLMGFRQPTEPTSEAVAHRRLSEFVKQEPDSPMCAAALSQWQLRNLQRELALETLLQVDDDDEPSPELPFYIGTLTEVLLELGQTERADEAFARWPQPADGYQYWRVAGLIAQEVDSDFARAAECYERALAIWPGRSDWLTMYRWFRSLALAGKTEQAEEARQLSEKIEELMALERHRRNKAVLGELGDPEQLQEIVVFYNELGREWEAREWQAVINSLKIDSLKQDSTPVRSAR